MEHQKLVLWLHEWLHNSDRKGSKLLIPVEEGILHISELKKWAVKEDLRVQSLEEHIEVLRDSEAKAAGETAELRGQLKRMRAYNAEKDRTIDEKEKMIATMTQASLREKEEKQLLQRSIDQLKNDLELEKANSKLNIDALVGKESQILLYRDQATRSDETNRGLQNTIADLNNKIAALHEENAKVHDKKANFEFLENGLKLLDKNLSAREESKQSALEQRIRDVESAEVSKARMKVEELQGALSELKTEKRDAQHTLEALRASSSEATIAMKSMEGEKKVLQEKNELLRVRLQELQKSLDDQTDRTKRLDSEAEARAHAALGQEMKRLQGHLDEEKSRRNAVENELKLQSNELGRVRAESKEAHQAKADTEAAFAATASQALLSRHAISSVIHIVDELVGSVRRKDGGGHDILGRFPSLRADDAMSGASGTDPRAILAELPATIGIAALKAAVGRLSEVQLFIERQEATALETKAAAAEVIRCKAEIATLSSSLERVREELRGAQSELSKPPTAPLPLPEPQPVAADTVSREELRRRLEEMQRLREDLTNREATLAIVEGQKKVLTELSEHLDLQVRVKVDTIFIEMSAAASIPDSDIDQMEADLLLASARSQAMEELALAYRTALLHLCGNSLPQNATDLEAAFSIGRTCPKPFAGPSSPSFVALLRKRQPRAPQQIYVPVPAAAPSPVPAPAPVPTVAMTPVAVQTIDPPTTGPPDNSMQERFDQLGRDHEAHVRGLRREIEDLRKQLARMEQLMLRQREAPKTTPVTTIPEQPAAKEASKLTSVPSFKLSMPRSPRSSAAASPRSGTVTPIPFVVRHVADSPLSAADFSTPRKLDLLKMNSSSSAHFAQTPLPAPVSASSGDETALGKASMRSGSSNLPTQRAASKAGGGAASVSQSPAAAVAAQGSRKPSTESARGGATKASAVDSGAGGLRSKLMQAGRLR